MDKVCIITLLSGFMLNDIIYQVIMLMWFLNVGRPKEQRKGSLPGSVSRENMWGRYEVIASLEK